MEMINNILADLTFLAEKAESPLIKITYAMAIEIVKDHFKEANKPDFTPPGQHGAQ